MKIHSWYKEREREAHGGDSGLADRKRMAAQTASVPSYLNVYQLLK